MSTAPSTVHVNGTDYRWPCAPSSCVCIDGGDPAYLRQFLADGSIPNIARFVREGYAAVADGSMPSFTCPNNMSIITGTPTAKHGISATSTSTPPPGSQQYVTERRRSRVHRTIRGRAAHSSTGLGQNACMALIPFLEEIRRINEELESAPQWHDARFQPPTPTLNLLLHDTNTGIDITSPLASCHVYFRPMPGQPADELTARMRRRGCPLRAAV
jgi:hypothetical protein